MRRKKAGSEIWAYCLMPNHVHLIVVPSDEDGLRQTFADAHRRYTGHINARNRWTGHLWQGRFGAVAMDEAHLAHAVRYVSLNPVRARLVAAAADWPWSSAAAHLSGADDGLVTVAPVLGRYGDFAAFLAEPADDALSFARLRQSETTGRPLGRPEWIGELEKRTGRRSRPAKTRAEDEIRLAHLANCHRSQTQGRCAGASLSGRWRRPGGTSGLHESVTRRS